MYVSRKKEKHGEEGTVGGEEKKEAGSIVGGGNIRAILEHACSFVFYSKAPSSLSG